MALRVPKNYDNAKVVKNLARRYKLVPHLDNVLAKEDFTWRFSYQPKVEDAAWHPSGDCTPSLHDLWLKATDQLVERPIGSLYKTFMVGHFWHQYLQFVVEKKLAFCGPEHIERRGGKKWGKTQVVHADHASFLGPDLMWGLWPVKCEFNNQFELVKPFHWITGAADIAPADIPGHGEYLVDFKTMNARDYGKQEAPLYYADKWECQINIYLDFFDLDKGLIVGICKDSPHEFKEFEFHRNQELIDVLYSKWELVSYCLDEGVSVPEGEDVPLPLKGVVLT